MQLTLFNSVYYVLEFVYLYGSILFAVTVSFIHAMNTLTQRQVLSKGLITGKSALAQLSDTWFDNVIKYRLKGSQVKSRTCK